MSEVWIKGSNSRSVYYGYGSTITILELPRYEDDRRFYCMTHRVPDCPCVEAVKDYLSQRAPVAGRVQD
jgi:hypothetical protein